MPGRIVPDDLDFLFPDDFRPRVRRLLGDDTPAFLRALAHPVPGLRVNTLRLSPERFREIAPFAVDPLPYPEAGFRVEEEARPGKHPYHAAGLYYLQDPGAMVVGALLDPRPGERVLDLAAAPGGKSTHLAARMEDRGLLLANDVHAGRAQELAFNLERCGVRRAIVTSEPVERLAAHFGAFFDRVLLDAPCSGEAMFHKSDAARQEWSEAAVAGCARRQTELMDDAARLVRPGGLLVYSTCTFSPEEDEEVIARFLAEHPEYELVALEPVPGAEPGRPEWVPEALRRPELERTMRIWPHRVPGAGHFVAGLRRREGEEDDPGAYAGEPVPRQARQLAEGFGEEFLREGVLGAGPWLLRGEELYELPPGAPALDRLRVVRPGWWLGTVRKNRFEPAHALAMALDAGESRDPVVLSPDDPEAHAYLRGETFSREGRAGWVVVTVDGYPLGWGKRTGHIVKNHYPKGLRWGR